MNFEAILDLRQVRFLVVFLASTGTAAAESMICENPRREYNLVYDQTDGYVLINPDSDKAVWSVISSVRNDSQHVVVVELGPEEMTAQIHLRPFNKVDIFSQGRLIQTDACHHSVDFEFNARPTAVQKSAQFSSFTSEIAIIQNLIKCPRATLNRDLDMPDLWGCIFPGAEVAKVFVNEDGNGGVENVKLMWNDWTRDVGYGVHTDGEIAVAWLSALATRYAPLSVEEVMNVFDQNQDATIYGSGYRVEYTYSKGPAIDERMVTITAE